MARNRTFDKKSLTVTKQKNDYLWNLIKIYAPALIRKYLKVAAWYTFVPIHTHCFEDELWSVNHNDLACRSYAMVSLLYQ